MRALARWSGEVLQSGRGGGGTEPRSAKYLGQRGSPATRSSRTGSWWDSQSGLVGQPHETPIQEYLALSLKDSVMEKWLYGNAARVFSLE
jgi:hypothetical protein